MKPTKLIGFVAAGIVIPHTIVAMSNVAMAGDVKISTPEVEAVTRSDGSVYVNTGGTTVRVPSRRRSWTSWRYWRFPWHKYTSDRSKCRHSSYQSTSHATANGSQTIQSSISSNSCH